MNAKKKLIHDCRLYWVAGPGDTELPLLETLDAAVKGGLDVFQLRDKNISDDEMIPLAIKVSEFLRHTSCLFIVNDRPHVAVAAQSDGVHIGQDDCSVEEARSVLNAHQLLGLSTHSYEQASAAGHLNVDYIGYGPIFKTPTKPTYVPVGPESIQSVINHVNLPVFCIGGIDGDNIDFLISEGANRVAVVREIAGSLNPYQVTRKIKLKLEAKRESTTKK